MHPRVVFPQAYLEDLVYCSTIHNSQFTGPAHAHEERKEYRNCDTHTYNEVLISHLQKMNTIGDCHSEQNKPDLKRHISCIISFVDPAFYIGIYYNVLYYNIPIILQAQLSCVLAVTPK